MHTGEDVEAHDEEAESLAQALKWGSFERGLRESNRFFLRDPSFFDETIAECLKYRITVPAGTEIFRARIVDPDQHWNPQPLGEAESGAPPKHLARAGRLNPEGIVVLYAARNASTAIAELRPWREARLSLATFRLEREVDAVDLTFMNSAAPKSRRASWAGYQFGAPVHAQDILGYLPTQYLAQKLAAEGIDAIEYDSAMRKAGVNLALFDVSAARFVSSRIFEVTDVRIDSRPFPPVEVRLPPRAGA